MSLEIRPGFRDIGPFSKAFSPPTIVFRNGMILRKVKGNRANFIQFLQFIAPSLHEDVDIPGHERHFRVFRIICTDTEVVNNHGAGLIQHPLSHLPHPEGEIRIFAVTRRIDFIESP